MLFSTKQGEMKFKNSAGTSGKLYRNFIVLAQVLEEQARNYFIWYR